MATTQEIQQSWEKGYLEGWRERSTITNPPNPTIPPLPSGIPTDHPNPHQFAHDEGKRQGSLARLRVQAGV